MIGLCALFFGPRATAVAVLATAACRLELGGVGTLPGLLTIVSSAAIGLWTRRRYGPDAEPPSNWHLYVFGLVIHVVMVLVQLASPDGNGLAVVSRIALPVLSLYPLSTLLAGRILSDQVASLRTEAEFAALGDKAPHALRRDQRCGPAA